MTSKPGFHMTRTPLVAFLERLERLVAGIGKLASWLILPVLLAVLFSIAAGVFRINKFAEWEQTLPVFGNALTMNSMLELQWHLFGILLLLTGAYALSENRHVRVDVLLKILAAGAPDGRDYRGSCVSAPALHPAD